jgi:hypothetical protein
MQVTSTITGQSVQISLTPETPVEYAIIAEFEDRAVSSQVVKPSNSATEMPCLVVSLHDPA